MDERVVGMSNSGSDEKVAEQIEAKKRERREARYMIYNKICRHCNQVLQTTSKKAVVHDLCRRDYYLSTQKSRHMNAKPRVSVANMSRERKRFFMMQPCEACKFPLLSKEREFLNVETNKLDKHHLCPNCIAMHKCGMLEGLTWKLLNEAEEAYKQGSLIW